MATSTPTALPSANELQQLLSISRHCWERYISRVKPSLEGCRDLAIAEIAALISGGCELTDEKPAWLAGHEDDHPSEVYAIFQDGIVFPIVRDNGLWVVTTTVSRSCMGEGLRAYINDQNRTERRNRRRPASRPNGAPQRRQKRVLSTPDPDMNLDFRVRRGRALAA